MAGEISGFQLLRRRNITLKKFLAVILGALFVLSFAASAFAIHAEIPSDTQAVVAPGATQITLGGELRVRGWYTDNIGHDDITALTGFTVGRDAFGNPVLLPDFKTISS